MDDTGLHLTSAKDGVMFDMLPDGVKEPTSWTKANSDDTFLVLDRNGNGLIDSSRELFGSATDQPQGDHRNGFAALAVFDSNHDKILDSRDTVFATLQFWTDTNHNGISEAVELRMAAAVGLISIDLNYRTLSRVDQFGNTFRYAARLRMIKEGRIVTRQAYDVFLVGQIAKPDKSGNR
jgi:hypothetical protein